MRLVKLPDNSWVNSEEIVQIVERTGQIRGGVQDKPDVVIILANEDTVRVHGYDIDQVASLIMETQFAVIDNDLIVNKSQVESIHVRVMTEEGQDPKVYTELKMVSGAVHFTDSDIEDVLGQLDGVPFFREEAME